MLAPKNQVRNKPSFAKYMQKESVYEKVSLRIESYKERSDYKQKQRWFEDYFKPLLSKIDLQLITWEELIDDIGKHDNKPAQELSKFYSRCLEFNQ